MGYAEELIAKKKKKIQKENEEQRARDYELVQQRKARGDFDTSFKKELTKELTNKAKELSPIKNVNTSRFKDGYQFGDIAKTVWATDVDIAGNILQGGLGAAEGVSDFARYRAADVLDFWGADKKAEKIRKNAQGNDVEDIVDSFKRITQGDLAGKKTAEQVVADDIIGKNSFITEDTKILGANARGVAQGVGNTIGYSLMTGYLGGASAGLEAIGKGGKIVKGIVDLAPIYMSSAGMGQTEAYQQGATDLQAGLYGTLSGGVEAISESLFGGLGKALDSIPGVSQALGFGKGALDDKIINAFTKNFKSTLMKNLVDLGVRSTGEGIEEIISGVGNAFLKKVLNMSDKSFGDLIKDENLLESFVSGTLSSLFMQAPSNTMATIEGREASTGITKNENKVVEAIVEERTKGQDLTKKEIQNIRNEVREDLQNGFIDTGVIEKTLGKDYNRSNDMYLQEAYNEKARKGTNFQVNLNDYKNEAQRNIVQKAMDSGILNDSKKTHSFVDLVSKLAADKGMDFDFVNNQKIAESGFAVEGKTVNGYVNGNTIGLNIESNNALNKTVGHEITHVLEGSDLYQTLQDSLKSYVGEAQWNARIKELTETYKNVENADVSKELTADLVGENLFNNEDFLRSLSTKDRNLFEKIFDEIKYLVQIATAGSKEKRDLVKLQKTFQEIYRDSKTTKEGTKYSIENDDKGQYVNIDTEQERFDGLSLEEKRKEAKKIIMERFSQEGIDNSKGKTYVNNTTSSKYTNPMEKISNSKKDAKYRASTELDNLLETSVKINDKPIPNNDEHKKHSFAKDGWDYYYSRFKVNGKEYIGKLNIGLNGENKTLYDITDINTIEAYKKMSDNGKLDKTSTDLIRSFIDNNISQNKENVKYSLTDNQGRELSKEQQEFFKDSKARDDEGKLKELYHGTATGEFYTFDKKMANPENDWGAGFYLTDNSRDVETNYEDGGPDFDNKISRLAERIEQEEDVSYDEAKEKAEAQLRKGGYRITSYANIENPAIVGETRLFDFSDEDVIDQKGIDRSDYDTDEDYDDALFYARDELIADAVEEALWEVEKEYDIDYYKDEIRQGIYESLEYGEGIEIQALKDKINEVALDVMDDDGRIVANDIARIIIESQGYDGIIDNTVSSKWNMDMDEGTTHYIAFKENQIKDVNNQTPTSNPDIRYSLTVQEANTGTDNNGNELSKEQKEYFKDSKATDENGNLITVYHTMTNYGKQFNVFNPVGTEKYRYGNQTVNFYTDSKEMSGSYADQDYRPADTRRLNTIEEAEDYLKYSTLRIVDLQNTNQAIKNHFKGSNERYYLVNGSLDVFGKYNTEKELLRNVVPLSQWAMRNNGKYQYEGYLNMTNPYVIDAKGMLWNRIANDNALEYKKQVKEKWDIPERQLDRLEGDTLKELNRDLTKLGWHLGYDNYGDMALWSGDTELAIDLLNVNDVMQEVRIDLDNDLKTPLTTNDVVFQVLAENEMGANYDGVIIENVIDNGGASSNSEPNTVYVSFNSNQFKAADNLNPTNDADIRYQLGTNEIAPTRGWNVRGRDIALESAIAPLQEQITQLQDTIEDLRENIAPIREEEVENLPTDENIEAPTRYNLTEEESQELDMLENLDNKIGLNDEEQARYDELRAKEENIVNEEDMTPIESLNDIRDVEEVGDRKIKAYQYEHPEVKPYFQEEARNMLKDLNNSTKGERYTIPNQSQNISEWDWIGLKRNTSPEIEMLLDGDLGAEYTYDDIRKGLNAIIEDNGAENIAVAKRIEFLLDERLRNGYDQFDVMDENYQPVHIEPNQDYLNMLREQSWEKYYEQSPWLENAPAEIEQPVIMMTPEEIAPTRETITEKPTRDSMELIDLQNSRNIAEQRTMTPKQKNNPFRRIWDFVMSKGVNRNVLTDRYSRKSGNRDIKFKADLRNNSMAEASYNITDGQTNNNFETIGKGVDTIFKELDKLKIPKAVANEFLIDYSNVDRWRNNKGSATPYEESVKRLRDYAIKYPELNNWAKQVWKYGENSLQNRVDAGLISQTDADYMRRIYPHYVPYINDVDNIDRIYEQSKELKAQELKRAKGGATKLMPVYDALTRYTMAEKQAIRDNDLYKEIVKTNGRSADIGIDERLHDTDLSTSLYSDATGNYLIAYEDGKQITTQIDADLFKELSRESEKRIKEIEDNLALIVKPLQKMNEFNRNIHTTVSLTFPMKNAIKDFGNAIFNSKHTAKMLKNYFPGLVELIRGKSKDVQQFKAGYGSGMTMGDFGYDSLNNKIKNNKFLKGIRAINEFIELAPRFAEFKASRQSGESIAESLYNAREITMNFSRGGTWVKAANRDGATFLNSSVQGFDKIIRNFSGENGAKGIASSLIKVAMFGIAPAIFNDLAFGGGSDDEDEDYKALPNYIKDNYYLIKRGDGEFIRIPKAQLYAVVGSAARRTMEAARGEENAFEGFLENADSQIGINNMLEDNVFAPLIQVNKGREVNGQKVGEAWYGGEIIPTRLQGKPIKEQYDEKTDKFSIWLGDKLNISPKKINYVLDQYSGGVGDVVLPWITEQAASGAEKPWEYALATVKDQFTANSTDDNKYVSNFYSKKEEITAIAGSENATEDEKLQKKYLDGISKEMSSLYAEKRAIQMDSSLSKKEKFAKANEIKKEINALAKKGLDTYKNVKTTGDYSSVNGTEYQKTEDGWKKVKDDESTEINSYGLNDSEKDKYFKTKSNISGIKAKYKDTKDYEGRRTDIVNEIRNADLPDDVKIALYNDSYRDKMAQSYVDAGVSVDAYLDFKSHTFTADKDKDGKSISGSKKQKVFDYVNSMNIPFEQKIMLVKTEYPSYKEYNRQIVNYLQNSGIEYNTMLELLKDMGFEVKGNNVSW